MNKKSIALIDPVGGKAGMDYYDLSLLKGMVALGYDSYLFSNHGVAAQGVHTIHAFHNIGVHKVVAIFNNFVYFMKALIFCKRKKINWLLLHLFRGGLFDLVTIGMARLLGIRIILIIHDVKSLDTLALPFTRKIILTHFNHSKVVHNRFSYNELAKEIKARSMGNVHIIPHGNYIELARSIPGYMEQIEGFRPVPGRRYLLFFGQLKKAKGLDLLIQALGRADSAYYLIVAGKERDESYAAHHKMMNEAGVMQRVTIINRFISDAERDFLFRCCEVVVLPYRRVYQSGVLLMAMSYAKPVIASGLEPFAEIIKDDSNGLLFRPESVGDLARVLTVSFKNKERLKALGEEGFRTVDRGNNWLEISRMYSEISET